MLFLQANVRLWIPHKLLPRGCSGELNATWVLLAWAALPQQRPPVLCPGGQNAILPSATGTAHSTVKTLFFSPFTSKLSPQCDSIWLSQT